MKYNIHRRILVAILWTSFLMLLGAGAGAGLTQSLHLSRAEDELSKSRDQVKAVMLDNESLVSQVKALSKSEKALQTRNRTLQEEHYLLSHKSKRLYKESQDLKDQIKDRQNKIGNLNAEVQSLLSKLSKQKESLPKEPEVEVQPVKATKKTNSKSKPSNVVKVMSPIATAYGASVRNGGAGTGKTYTGVSPVEGRTIAADPKVLPIGTVVWIECPTFPSVNGRYVVEDIGGAINGSRIDIYMDDSKRSTMLDFGRRKVTLSVLSK